MRELEDGEAQTMLTNPKSMLTETFRPFSITFRGTYSRRDLYQRKTTTGINHWAQRTPGLFFWTLYQQT